MTETQNDPTTTFYNGACPVCRMEIEHYQRRAEDADAPMSWCDVSQTRDALSDLGVDEDEILRRLYVRTSDGRLLGGIDAFLEIWQGIPRMNWLAKVIGLPVIYPVACFLYDRAVAPALFHWNIRTGRVDRRVESS